MMRMSGMLSEGRATALALCAFIGLCGALPARAQELVTNGGFESVSGSIGGGQYCQATSWTTAGNCGVYYFYTGGIFPPRTGAYNLAFGSGSGYSAFSASQTLTVAGGRYTFSFWYGLSSGAGGATFSAQVGSNVFSVPNAPRFTNFSRVVTLSGATTISFNADSFNPANAIFQIDDVSLVFLSALPAVPLSSNLPPNAPGNAGAVAGAIDSFGGAPPSGFAALGGMSGDQLVRSLAQISGEGSSGSAQALFQASNQFVNMLVDPSTGGAGGDRSNSFASEDEQALAYAGKKRRVSADPKTTEAYAAVTPRDRRAPVTGRWSVWAAGYGGSSTVDGNATTGASGTTSHIYGTAVGASYRVSLNTLVGFALGGAGFNYGVSDGLGNGRADVFQVGAYGRHNMGASYLAAALAYGWQDVTTDRTVTIAGADALGANFQAHSFAARGEIGHRFGFGVVGLTPYGALQYTGIHLPAYAENAVSGSGQFALAFASQDADNLRSEVGLRADHSLLVAGGLVTLRGRAAWAHDSDTERTVTPTFQSLPGSSSFTINGARPAANSALLTAGAEFKWHNGWSIAATYEGELSNTTSSNAGKGTVRYAF
jgi:uncharacterized protein YhjY with autotransporter beta-barrel domain